MSSYYHRGGRFVRGQRGRGRGRGRGQYGHCHNREDDQGKDVFNLLRPNEYQQAAPLLEQPQVIGCYSVDEDRNFGHDRSLLKFIDPQYLPQEGRMKVELDLERGSEENREYTGRDADSLHNLLQWILNNTETLLDSDASPPRLDVDFVCMRRCLNQVMKAPYNIRDRWILLAESFRDTVYIARHKTEEEIMEYGNDSPYIKKVSMWGHKFEQYMTGGDPDEGSCPNEEFRCVLRTKFGDTSLLLAPEVDGADPELHEEDFKDLSTFITTKCSKEIPDDPFKQRSFRKFKLNQWWSENKLLGIPRVVVGFRNEEGIVHTLESIDTDDLPRLAQGEWEPGVCLNILSIFLAHIRKKVMEAPNAVHRFERESPGVIRHSVLPAATGAAGICYNILPQWYRAQLFSSVGKEDQSSTQGSDEE